MEREAIVLVYDSDKDDWDEWKIIIDTEDKTFILFDDDNGFDIDIDIDEVLRLGILDKAKWSSDSSRIMIIGLFEIGIKG